MKPKLWKANGQWWCTRNGVTAYGHTIWHAWTNSHGIKAGDTVVVTRAGTIQPHLRQLGYKFVVKSVERVNCIGYDFIYDRIGVPHHPRCLEIIKE